MKEVVNINYEKKKKEMMLKLQNSYFINRQYGHKKHSVNIIYICINEDISV